tara:strand:+ start:579 stop:932 length:354 start_codon:yes stop_codon:yes gene_type:complete
MPIINGDHTNENEIFPGVRARPIVNSSLGSDTMSINMINIDPNAAIPAHIHPSHEEVLIIVEGSFSYELGDEKGDLTQGDSVLIPPTDRHYLINTSNTTGTVIAIFPVTSPERIIVD